MFGADVANLYARLCHYGTFDIYAKTTYAYRLECNNLVDAGNKITTFGQELCREVALERRQLHLSIQFSAVGVDIHTDMVGHIRTRAERESEETILVGLCHMACGTTIYAERVLHGVVGYWREEVVGNLDRCHHLARAIELILYIGMYGIVDVVSNLQLTSEEQRFVGVGLPLGVCSQGIFSGGCLCRERYGVVVSATRAHHSQAMCYISCCINQLHIYKLGVGSTIEVDRIHEECAEIDCIACTVKRLVGHDIQLLLYTARGVVVDETIGHKVRETYRCLFLVCFAQSLCRRCNRYERDSP